jgi:Kef-type K+ transport system membrane component KefB
MCLIGWEFDKRLLKGRRQTALSVSLSSVVVAFGLGAGLGYLLYPDHAEVDSHHVSRLAFSMFMGAAMSVTAFPVLARILADNRMLKTRVGALALASAAIDDLLAWCLLAYVSALVTADGGFALLRIALLSTVFIAVMFLVVKPALAVLTARAVRTERWRSVVLLLAAGVFVSSALTTWIGIHAIFGAFLFGFVMPREPAELLAQRIHQPFEQISLVLMPVFFIVTGLGVNIAGLGARQYLELAAIIAVACAGKLIGAIVPARLNGLPWKESAVLGLLINTRGLTELIMLNAARELGILDGQMFTMMVLMALATTVITGPLLPRGPMAEPVAARRVPDLAASAAAPCGGPAPPAT